MTSYDSWLEKPYEDAASEADRYEKFYAANEADLKQQWIEAIIPEDFDKFWDFVQMQFEKGRDEKRR